MRSGGWRKYAVQRGLDEIETLFTVAKGLERPKNPALEVYHRLVYNRFEDFIKTSFPLFSSFAGEELEPLIGEFLKLDHTSPLLIDLGREFVEFFKETGTNLKESKPFLEDLLLYEWSEIEVFNAPDEDGPSEFSWKDSYRLSVSSKLLHLRYPVHRAGELSPEEILKRQGDHYILLYRDRESEVKRVKLTAFVYKFLRDINSGISPIEAFEKSELGEEKEEAKPYLERFLRELLELGVLVKN